MWLKGRVNSSMLKEMFTMVNGPITKRMDLGYTRIREVQDLKVIGKMTYSMEKVQKTGQKEQIIKENITSARSKVLENTLTLMVQPMMVNGSKIK